MNRGRWDSDTDPDDDAWSDAAAEDWTDRDEDDTPEKECAYCGTEMYENSIRCPRCGRYQSEEDSASSRQPSWMIATAVILLIIALAWFSSLFGSQ